MTIQHRQAELEEIHAEIFGLRNDAQHHQGGDGGDQHRHGPVQDRRDGDGVHLDDQELLQRALGAHNGPKFRKLWEGDSSDYSSASEADLALCSHLVFWTSGDIVQVDRLFRQSGLYRDKWGERHGAQTYGELTIGKALEGATEFYGSSTNGSHSEGATLASPRPTPKWPAALAPEAFHGLPGDIVRAVEPHTEADSPALLVNVLVAAGNAMGASPHAVAEADRHGTNIDANLVGETAKGRKGSSWGHIRTVFAQADPAWAERIASGLSSGEGLIWEVRDPIEKQVAVKDKGRSTGEYTTEIVDLGVEDKRLLVMEPEFAATLKVATREGSTLSTTIRQAWDTGALRILTKNSPAKATGAHISVLGHITKDELLRYLSDTEVANGFANRFMWICARRARVLPEGGGKPDYSKSVDRLRDALKLARNTGELQWDAAARQAWHEIYPDLSEGKPGLLGAVTARAEAIVLRLSVIYVALDGATAIGLPHLKAALAVWDYAEASARYIFGDATGDPVADRILECLRQSPDGLKRVAMHDLFGRNIRAIRLSQALGLLLRAKRAVVQQVETEGRSYELWRAT